MKLLRPSKPKIRFSRPRPKGRGPETSLPNFGQSDQSSFVPHTKMARLELSKVVKNARGSGNLIGSSVTKSHDVL